MVWMLVFSDVLSNISIFLHFLPFLFSNNLCGLFFFAFIDPRKTRLLTCHGAAPRYQNIYWDKNGRTMGVKLFPQMNARTRSGKNRPDGNQVMSPEENQRIGLYLLFWGSECGEGIGLIWALCIFCWKGRVIFRECPGHIPPVEGAGWGDRTGHE